MTLSDVALLLLSVGLLVYLTFTLLRPERF
jgi:K+-transporting ATPase KdpF subunit